MVLEILPLTVVCSLAIAFLVACFLGFHGALHEKPSFQANVRRERALILGRVEPNTVHLSKRNLLHQQHSWAATSREILSSSYAQSAGRHVPKVARHAALAECRVLVPHRMRVPQSLP
jgi:hypothetical protein